MVLFQPHTRTVLSPFGFTPMKVGFNLPKKQFIQYDLLLQ